MIKQKMVVMVLTLIECFADSHIDNIAACLRLRPETLIMVGDADEMCQPVKRYRELLRKRGQRTQIVMRDVRGKDFGDICAVLAQLVRETGACVIDMTGGNELVVMAVGAVLAGLDSGLRETIQVQKYDHRQGTVVDCMQDNRRLPCKPIHLTVEELIALHGGALHPNASRDPEDSALAEVNRLWSIVAEAPKEWNRAIALLNEFESRSDSSNAIYLPLDQLHGSISNFDEKEAVVRELLDRLQRRNIIDDHSNWYALEYTYRSPLLRYCTLKAGNVLEVKTLLEGRTVLADGKPLFHEGRMSVSIDWDGIVRDPAERIPETRNEIDVVLMHEATPLFVSCKNGSIGEEELYKLHTVASRFGGPYARKMLVATELNQKSLAANRALIQRAWDMDIFLVTDAAELSKEEWQQAFQQAVQ